ncbi:MAG: VCBS repeat-containing protein, partial [Planctomycetes bacterium]|nr:VCBS repeat-containing protein [Planctomycetota bacterium]
MTSDELWMRRTWSNRYAWHGPRSHRPRIGVLLLCLLAPAALVGCKRNSGPDEPGRQTPFLSWFEDVAEAWGVDFHHDSGHDGRYLFPESVAGGVCLLDYDNDGRLDIYFVQSGPFDTAGEEDHIGNQLFRNTGGGGFVDVSSKAGVSDTGYGMGCACGDFDNDGDTDLYVTNVGANVLYRNNGDGTFTDVTYAAGLEDSAWSSSAAFVDYDADGDLDLFVVNYMNWSPALERNCLALDQSRDFCAPRTYNAPAVDALYRNEGDGTFEEVTREAGLDRAKGNGLGVACGDFDRDGRVDIYVANDAMDNQLWINQGGGRFKDEALVRGCAVNGFGTAEAGMGVVAWDADADGSQVGPTLTPNALVTDGRFTVALDFGADIFTGDARYLEIAVCCPAPCEDFTTLSPRQELTPAPYALALPGLYTRFDFGSIPNIIGGFRYNAIESGTAGGTIAGGGNGKWRNRVFDHYGTVSGGSGNEAGSNDDDLGTSMLATVGGGFLNTASGSSSTVGGGEDNFASGPHSTVGGGDNNAASNDHSTVGGGEANIASGPYSTIGGGESNLASGEWNTVAGGQLNIAESYLTSIGGGTGNIASGGMSTICGGLENTTAGYLAAVGGGVSNDATGEYSGVGGGWSNTAEGDRSTVGGGSNNWAAGGWDTIAGGEGNLVLFGHNTIGGGESNFCLGDHSTIGGGSNNTIEAGEATIGGGSQNTASGWRSTIGGGNQNLASGDQSAIGGGYANFATSEGATISGGLENNATGISSTVAGGFFNVAGGDYSFAAGRNARAGDDGTFVWADSTDAAFPSATEVNFTPVANQFLARTTGGVVFVSAVDGATGDSTAGVELAAGGGSWSSLSSRDAKANVDKVDGREVLERLRHLPIATWNYKAQDESIRHIGPMAQDFSAAFGVGEKETMITTIDADGVALAAIP